MFIDFREHPRDKIIETDVCVIGAGAAGISLTQALAGSELDVCVFETGGFSPEVAYAQLAKTEPQLGDYATAGCRLRFFGGSTNHWGGNNMPLDALDFEARPWVEHSGWPITRAALDPWYAQANEVLNAGAYAYTRAQLLDDSWPFPDLDLELLKDVYWRLTPNPTTFAGDYKATFETAANVRVFLHATVTELHADKSGATVQHATVKDAQGKQTEIRAKHFVIAAGAMESSRLLLASHDVNAAGLGNDTDQLGRYFMMHPHLDIGRVAGLGEQLVSLFDRHTRNGIEIIAGISANAASQRSHEILNGAIMLQGLPDDTTGYVAMLNLREALQLRYRAWRGDFEGVELDPQAGEWAWLVLTDFDSVIAGLWQKLSDPRFQGTRAGGRANIYLQSEQAPNPNSRITLGTELDALGVPRMLVDTQVLPIDKKTLRVTGELLGRELGLLNAGRVQLDEWLLDDTVDWKRQIWGGCHHMGTTRMSGDPASGVVNENCRLHSVDNTYVASASVFPTSGHANPTITIVALALRLAEHLKSGS
jgi:choline dehydrogenase-like flavoprotein